MDDDTEAETFQPLWVDWTERIISFHQEAGYERLEFSSNEEKMAYVFEKTSNGFRIQWPAGLLESIITRRNE